MADRMAETQLTQRGAAHMPEGLVGAVDVGATKTLVAVVALPLRVWDRRIATRRFATPADPDELGFMIDASVRDLAGGGRVLAIGIGTPGPLDVETGVVRHSVNQQWHDVPLAELVAARTGSVVRLDDDANTGALGEAHFGAGRDCDPFVYVTVSTGIGAGIVIGGRVVRGAHGAAGEFGHFTFNPAGPRCSCGGRGHVETYAGGNGFVARASAVWRTTHADGLVPVPMTAESLIRYARGGDAVARRLVDEAVEALATGLAAIVASVDPERIAVGGSLALAQGRLIQRAATRARELVISDARPALRVVRAGLGPHSVLAGAALLGSSV